MSDKLCARTRREHTHGDCLECFDGKRIVPTITVNAANDGSHAWITIHDDGSVCDKIVTPVAPSYIPGSVVELHDKRTRIMHARPGVRRVGWRKGPVPGTI